MKDNMKMVAVLFAGTAGIALLLLGTAILPLVSAQTGGNLTQMLQSAKQGSALALPVQQGSQVFVGICTAPEQCTIYDLTPLPP